MIRMYFYFWVLYNYINSYDQIKLLVNYFIIIIINYIFFVVMKQKYLMGMFQSSGPFPHQNSLVMYLIILSGFIFAKLLNSKEKNIRTFLILFITFGMSGISIISTLSRAGMACFAISLIVILLMTFSSGFNMKKISVTFLLILIGASVLFKAMDSIIERFNTAPEESKDTRVALAISAVNMANSSIIGVGLNNFSLKLDEPYTFSPHIDSSDSNENKKGGLVETIYLMIAAETGWGNLIVFLALLLTTYSRNVINYIRYKNHEYRYVLIGLCGGLTGIYIESTLEWVLKQSNNFYQLMMVIAITGVMTKLLQNSKNSKSLKKRINNIRKLKIIKVRKKS